MTPTGTATPTPLARTPRAAVPATGANPRPVREPRLLHRILEGLESVPVVDLRDAGRPSASDAVLRDARADIRRLGVDLES